MSVLAAAPPVLLPELLGHSPHFVLDTIVNISNNSVEHCVDAMEGFLTSWAEKRTDRLKDSGGDDWDSKQEIEQGVVAFQTLLESHMDIALDFFEVWCMRNIFTIPAELPVVVPHQAGLILDQPAGKEQELLSDIDDLRRRIQVVRIPFLSFPVGVLTHLAFLATEAQKNVQEGVADIRSTKDGERADVGSANRDSRACESASTGADWRIVRGYLGIGSGGGWCESDGRGLGSREARMGDRQARIWTLGRH